MKPRPNRLGMYADVKEILDAALASAGGELQMQSYGAAVHWRQRAYRFRKLFAETLGPKQLSPYDVLTFPRIDEDSSTVVIKIQQTAGKFVPAKPAVHEPAGDSLLDEALQFAETLKEKKNG